MPGAGRFEERFIRKKHAHHRVRAASVRSRHTELQTHVSVGQSVRSIIAKHLDKVVKHCSKTITSFFRLSLRTRLRY